MTTVNFVLALVGLITVTLACNSGERRCASEYWGIECRNGQWKNVYPCARGTYCQMKENNFTCKRSALIHDDLPKDAELGHRLGHISVPGVPNNITYLRTHDPGLLCEDPNIFCATILDGFLSAYCAPGAVPQRLLECRKDEKYAWTPALGDVFCQSARCLSDTTSGYQKLVPTAIIAINGAQPTCDRTRIFCADSEFGDIFVKCKKDKLLKVVH